MARQMTVEDRKRMDFLLQLGWTPAQIAEDRGRSKSTILHETINRSVPCDRGYRRSNRMRKASRPHCLNPKTQRASHYRQDRCVYLCNGAFTFAHYRNGNI